MTKLKKVQSIICLVIYFLFANQAWAEEWIFYSSTSTKDAYYDKSSIKKVNKNIIHVWAKGIFNENGKKYAFSFLAGMDKAPDNSNLISYVLRLSDIDCVKEKIKDYSTIIYDKKSNVLYSSPKGENDKWNDIVPNSVGQILKNIVCEEHILPMEAVFIEPTVTDKNLAKVSRNQNETKYIPKEAFRNLVTKWLNSWKSGDMETYRNCYDAAKFQSKGMNLDAWISHKTNVYQKSKNINISIDKLQISAGENNATAVFTQSYSSSIFNDSGKKKLELRKINDEWKIYRETMSP